MSKLSSLERRITALEQSASSLGEFAALAPHFNTTFYDELPDELKTLFCDYKDMPRELWEKICLRVLGDTHIIVQPTTSGYLPQDDKLTRIIEEEERKYFERNNEK